MLPYKLVWVRNGKFSVPIELWEHKKVCEKEKCCGTWTLGSVSKVFLVLSNFHCHFYNSAELYGGSISSISIRSVQWHKNKIIQYLIFKRVIKFFMVVLALVSGLCLSFLYPLFSSIKLLVFCYECHSLIGYPTNYLFLVFMWHSHIPK